MKYKLLRFSLLSMLVMFFGGLAFAQDETIDFSALGYENAAEVTTVQGTNVTLSFDKGTSSNAPKYYNTGTAVRMYGGNTVKISSNTKTIEKVVFTFSSSSYDLNNPTVDTGNYDSETSTWSGSATEFTVTRGGTSGHARIQKMEFYYAAGETPAATVATPVISVEELQYGSVNVSITSATEGAAIHYTLDGTDPSASSEAYSAPFSLNETKTVKAIAVKGDATSAIATKVAAVHPTLQTVLELNALENGTKFQFDGKSLLVVAKPTTKYVFVKDETGACLIYDGTGNKTNAAEVGKYIEPGWKGSVSFYNKLFEAVPDADLTVYADREETVAYEPVDLSYITADHINEVVKIEGVTYTLNNKNLTLTKGDVSVAGYNQFGLEIATAEDGKTYNIVGAIGRYNDNIQFQPISIEEAVVTTGWLDIKADFTNGSFFTKEETSVTTAGLKMNADGTFTRVAADDATANAAITGKYHSNEHGLQNFSATVKVEGPVKISFGTCAWGGNVTVKDDTGTEVVPAFTTNTGACYHQDKTKNIVSVYYKGEAATLTIAGGSYVPYFAVESVDPSEIPSEATLTFNIGETGAEGIAPAEKKMEIGSKVTVPANTTLYVEGKTLTAWTDGTKQYKAGEEVTVSEDITLTPVFTDNTVKFADRTAEVSVTWDATQKTGGAPLLGFERNTGFIVGQAAINGETIDLKLTIDATSGKFNNSNGEWIQVNNGTKFILPACKGASYSIYTMGDSGENTFNGEKGTYASNYDTYTYEGSEETMEIVVGGGSWYKAITAVYPVPAQEEPAAESKVIFSWEGGAEGATQKGGTVTATDASGADLTADDVNMKNSTYNTIRLRGAKDFSTNVVVITLDEALQAGDKIAITAYRNKNAADKQTGALLKFANGSTTVSTATTGLEFVNIDASDASAADSNRGTEPNTVTLAVPEDAAGSKTITLTRAATGTNLFITKIEITGERSGEEPGEETGFQNFAVQLTNADAFDTKVNKFGVKVAKDGTYTATAFDDATANFTVNAARFNDAQHGWVNCEFTVPVQGPVKVGLGNCQFGAQDGTITDAAGNVTALTVGNANCWHNNTDENISYTIYKGTEPTTLTIKYNGYCPFISVEAVDPADLKSDATVTFAAGEAGDVVVPAAVKMEIGKTFTLPNNFTMYVEGKTMTAWTDGTNDYAVGSEFTVPESDVTLTAKFTANEVSLSDRTEPVTLKFDFMRQDGAPTVGYQNQTGVWVAQATVNGKTIDVKADFDTNNGGKFNNGGWTDWAQMNGGTKWTIPSCKGAVVTIESYSATTTTTIDGQTDYEKTGDRTVQYTIANTADNIDIVIGDGSYYRYIQVVLPVVQSGPKTYTNEAATVNWPLNDSGKISDYTATPNDAFSTVAANIGDLEITGVATRTADDAAKGISFVKFRPSGSTKAVEWVVKPSAGLTFTPTKISLWIQRFGTDAENGVTVTAKVGEGEAITLGNYTAPRANQDTTKDKYAGNSNYTNQVVINLTAEQQEALKSGEALTLAATVGVGGTKEGGFSDVNIEGLINGTMAEVEKYTLATVAAPEEAGSINVYPKADEYEAGTEVTLTATENFGYDFVNWTNAAGEEVSTEAKFKYAVAANETLTANFKKVNTYELALTVDGTNDYMVTINPAPTVVEGKNMYEEGATVQLVANQYEGLVTFTNWNDGETNSTKTVAMTENKNIVASYAEADIIAGWDFYTAGASGRKADFAAQDNDADALNLVNTETGETQGWLDKSTIGGGGYESFKGAAVNWRTGTKNGDVGNWHWQTKVNAEAFTDIKVQFMMLYNYNSYQTYNAEYSLDGETWTKFGSITMTGAKAEAAFSEQMPAAANNQKDLYIRMLADKTSAVDGAASANDGNTLAMFFITGTPKLVDDGTAPKLVSSVPENGATGASATGKIVLTFDERVKVKADAKATLGNETLTPTVSGKTVTFEYKGLEYGIEYTFNLAANSVGDLTDNFLAEPITLTFTTMERPSIEKKMYDQVVSTADELVAAITAAQARADKNVRYRIFIKNGKYTIPLSSTMKTVNGYEVPECITFINTSNVSFIGESRDGVIITNGIDKNETFAGTYGTTSKYDGIGNSDVFQISGSDYYFQDLTIESGMDDATGRDLAVQDKATRTIYKNTGLSGYQDTWTSNNDYGLYYFEGGFVRGRTDYMCGKGDAFFNGVEIRQIAGGYAAVPSKSIKYGYVYKDCTINGEGSGVDGNYTLGRPWGSGTPIALFIDTRMNVVPSAIGWNEMSGGWPKRFAEYNSTTSTGSVIDLSGRKKIFGDGHENNPVLTAEEALEAGNLHNMFGDWDPTLLTEQAPVPANVKLTGTTLTWDNSNYALLFAIVKNGQVVDFTTDATYTVDDATATYAVRAANEMGGLGEAAEALTSDGIEEIAPATVTGDSRVYNLQGIRMQKAQKGVYIVNGKKIVVK